MLLRKAGSLTRIQSEWMMVLPFRRVVCSSGTHEGMRGRVWPVANTTRLPRSTWPVDKWTCTPPDSGERVAGRWRV